MGDIVNVQRWNFGGVDRMKERTNVGRRMEGKALKFAMFLRVNRRDRAAGGSRLRKAERVALFMTDDYR